MKLEFSQQMLNNTQIPNLMNIRPVGAEMIRADRRMDERTGLSKLIVAFRNFANTPKKVSALLNYSVKYVK